MKKCMSEEVDYVQHRARFGGSEIQQDDSVWTYHSRRSNSLPDSVSCESPQAFKCTVLNVDLTKFLKCF